MGRILKLIHRIRKDYVFRTTIFSGITFTINFFYAAWQAILAGYYGSLWFGALATYYFSICMVRGFTLNFERLTYKDSGIAKLRRSLRYYLFTGIMMFLINVVFAVLLWFILTVGTTSNSGAIPVIGSAAYAVYKLVLAIINAAKAKKYDDYVIRALRNITLADAIISLYAMEATMITVFGDGVQGELFPLVVLTGLIAGAACLSIGVYMVAVSSIKLKKLPAADAPDE